jgi:NAD(P)-dependent dehydrogenase (short-subunit alcohol dehydrogenase family)
MKSFAGRVAAVTGAASGMGRALAVELARRQCHVAASDVDEAGLAETVALASAHGVRVTSARVDVADRAAVFAWAEAVVRDHGRVNLIFNNAGVALAAPLAEVRPEDFEWIMGINFWGVVHGCQAFLPHLFASGEGHVVNTSSLFGLCAVPGVGPYNASKFAVRGYTEALRLELELAGAPVSATCVHPGGIRTNIAIAGRIDERIHALTGRDAQTSRARFDRLLSTTTAEEAARQILAGVSRDARRVLVGADAKLLDPLLRLVGSGYQPIALWLMRRWMR